jgi:mannose-6-phosphate isomerase-like protein (cupin superfamily)
MSAPRYWKERADEDVREVTGMHDGVGAIRIRRFFPDLTTTGVSMDIWELAPGTTEGRHTHASTDPVDDYEEIYVILAGQGVLELEGEDVPLEPGDAVLVPVDVDHGLRVTGDVPLRILLIFAHPRS